MATDNQIHVIEEIEIDVSFQELKENLAVSKNSENILSSAEKNLKKVRKIWQPKAVYRWFDVQGSTERTNGITIQTNSMKENFDLGFSTRFVTDAKQILLAAYTIGIQFEHVTAKSSAAGDLLESYFFDIIGMIALDKTGETIRKIAEEQASQLGWGTSPFLSPGSVHGWDLVEQVKLCSLLPLEKINMKIGKDAVLSPFKSISCLIGLGPGYKHSKVGSTCRVCAKNDDCLMKQDHF